MEQTFGNIDLKEDTCDYASLGEKDEIKKAKTECVKDEFLDELIKIQNKLPNGSLKNKYKAFIADKQKLYDDWSDCIVKDGETLLDYSSFRGNGYDEYYFGDLRWEYDVISDYFIDNYYLFINPDASYTGDGFVDEAGNSYKSPYFRYIDISEYEKLDNRLLVVYADYFIKKYGFARWFLLLSTEQRDFIKKNVDNIELTPIQKIIVEGAFNKPFKKEDYLERIFEIETSEEIAKKGDKFDDKPFIGYFSDKLSEYEFANVDVTKLKTNTFWFYVDNLWSKLARIKNNCESRIIAEFIMDDKNFSNGKLKTFNTWTFHRYFNKNPNEWNINEIKHYCEILNPSCADANNRIKILKDAFSFKKWFEDNKVNEYRNTFKRIQGVFWNLEDAYQAVNDPLEPKLWIDSSISKHARVI